MMVSNTVLVITLLLSIFLIDRSSESYTTFHDAVTGTAIKYPQNWLKNPRGLGITPGSNIVVFDSPNIDSHNDYVSEFSVGIENAPPGFTLNGYMKEFITLLQHWGRNFQLVHTDANSTLAGSRAYILVFTLITPHDKDEYGIISGTRIGSKVYSIVSQTDVSQYSNYLPTILNMINSFHLVN
ncbi:MAG: hypothetical protein JO327_13395 [Nitrososphaeraceae archaeon]|nr:hypothetical protein [Nitrososphaeraceae archaeon]